MPLDAAFENGDLGLDVVDVVPLALPKEAVGHIRESAHRVTHTDTLIT